MPRQFDSEGDIKAPEESAQDLNIQNLLIVAQSNRALEWKISAPRNPDCPNLVRYPIEREC
jgi:hypothetical protein